MVRVARIHDAKAIHKLLMNYAKDGMMLSRSLSDIYEAIRDFFVYEEGGEVVGTVCLSICWEDLAEVRSLAVAEGRIGGGVGRLVPNPFVRRPDRLHLGRGARVADTARALSAYCDAIVVRTYAQRELEELAEAASVPVVNALSDDHHPCQALADLLTVRELLGGLAGRRLAFVGDGRNNVVHSLLEAVLAVVRAATVD